MYIRMYLRLNYLFSAFKTRLQPLRGRGNPDLADLYYSMAEFQSKLDHLQLIKYQKSVYDMSRKFNNVLRKKCNNQLTFLPLTLTHTHQFFLHKENEYYFGDENKRLHPTLQQMQYLSSNMVKHYLSVYYSQLLPVTNTHPVIFQHFKTKFKRMEEEVCRLVFAGYLAFYQQAENSLFQGGGVYKGKFKFELTEDITMLEEVSSIVRDCSLFNGAYRKMVLVAELALKHHLSLLSPQAVANYLLCLAINGKPIKDIDLEILKFKLGHHSLELLLYCTIANIDDYTLFKTATENFVLQDRYYNTPIEEICSLLNVLFKQKHGLILPHTIKIDNEKIEPQGEKYFADFLRRDQYVWSVVDNPISHHTMYEIEMKQFLVLGFLYYDQQLKFNGLSIILREYFSCVNHKNIKFINWPRIAPIDKRGQRDTYTLSKFKGINRPRKIRKRWYE